MAEIRNRIYSYAITPTSLRLKYYTPKLRPSQISDGSTLVVSFESSAWGLPLYKVRAMVFCQIPDMSQYIDTFITIPGSRHDDVVGNLAGTLLPAGDAGGGSLPLSQLARYAEQFSMYFEEVAVWSRVETIDGIPYWTWRAILPQLSTNHIVSSSYRALAGSCLTHLASRCWPSHVICYRLKR